MKFAGQEFKPSKSNGLVLRKINAKTITLDTGGNCLTESFETEEECEARWKELMINNQHRQYKRPVCHLSRL